jgi:hypothetical protein
MLTKYKITVKVTPNNVLILLKLINVSTGLYSPQD